MQKYLCVSADLAIPESDVVMMNNYAQLDEFSKRRMNGLVSRIKAEGFSGSEFRVITDAFLQECNQ